MTLIPDKLPAFIFTGTPGELSFRKKGILTATGGRAKLTLILDDADPPQNGDTLILNFGDLTSITITFSGSSDAEDTVDYYVSGSFNTYVTNLVNDFNRHGRLNKYYTITLVSYDAVSGMAVIVFEALNRGTAYNIEIDAASTLHYNDTDSSATVIADDDAQLEDYKLSCTVELIGDYTYNPVSKRYENIEANGVLDTEADEMKLTLYELPAMGKTNSSFDVPLNAFKCLPARKAFGLMRVIVRESYTGADKKNIVQSIGDFQDDGLYGLYPFGAPINREPFGSIFLSWWNPGLFQPLSLFSLQPGRKKVVTKEQPEWLSFLALTPFDFSGEFIVYYSDGTTQNKAVSYSGNFGIYTAPTGYAQAGLADLNPGGLTELYYTFRVLYIGDPYSELFTYVLDSRLVTENRYFIYQNSLGVVDTLRCYGVNAFSLKRRSDTAQKIRTGETRAEQGTMEMIYNEHEQRWTMRTGWLMNKAEKEFLQDFLLSTYVAEVTMPLLVPVVDDDVILYYRQQFRSVIIEQESIDMWEEQDGKWALQFTMKYAETPAHYNNMPLQTEYWFDTQMEFTIVVTALSGGTDTIGIFVNAECNMKVVCNGIEQDWTTGEMDITKRGVYHFKLSASECFEINFVSTGITADLSFNHVETITLQNLYFFFWNSLPGEYLPSRLATLATLINLTIQAATDPGFDIDSALQALAVNYNQNGLLATVDFTYATPSAAGYLIKDYLNTAGVTVTTA